MINGYTCRELDKAERPAVGGYYIEKNRDIGHPEYWSGVQWVGNVLWAKRYADEHAAKDELSRLPGRGKVLRLPTVDWNAVGPDLLAALQWLIDYAPTESDAAKRSIEARARAAIRRAEGGE